MEYTTYVRKPFEVNAVEVTDENLEEVAKLVGDLEVDGETGARFILVDHRKVPNVNRVFPGFFMTKMGRQVRCYSRRIFHQQFVLKDDNVQAWLDFLNGDKEEIKDPLSSEAFGHEENADA